MNYRQVIVDIYLLNFTNTIQNGVVYWI